MTLYVPAYQEHLLVEVVTRFPGESQSAALMMALEEWSAHRKAVDKWNEEHPEGKI